MIDSYTEVLTNIHKTQYNKIRHDSYNTLGLRMEGKGFASQYLQGRGQHGGEREIERWAEKERENIFFYVGDRI